jgi:hypothetical protein
VLIVVIASFPCVFACVCSSMLRRTVASVRICCISLHSACCLRARAARGPVPTKEFVQAAFSGRPARAIVHPAAQAPRRVLSANCSANGARHWTNGNGVCTYAILLPDAECAFCCSIDVHSMHTLISVLCTPLAPLTLEHPNYASIWLS